MLPENFHPHSRYVLKETPWGFNASDLIHSDISGPVFDLGVDLDNKHGIAYIRVTDVEEMARVLGMATREEVRALNVRIEELNAEVLNVPREVESLKDGLSVLVADFLDRVIPRADRDVSVPAPESTEAVEGQLELPIGPKSGDGSESGGDTKQSGNAPIDKGPNELSSGKLDGFGLDGIDSK